MEIEPLQTTRKLIANQVAGRPSYAPPGYVELKFSNSSMVSGLCGFSMRSVISSW